MSYDLTIDRRGDVLCATATGTRSIETVLAITEEVRAACLEHGVKKVLTDVRGLQGQLSASDTFQLPDQHFRKMRSGTPAITRGAVVDTELSRDRHGFFENVCVNRGFNVRVFSDPVEAMTWLEDDLVDQSLAGDAPNVATEE